MQQLPDNCVDTIFADPPYNLQLNTSKNILHRPKGGLVDGVTDDWDKFASFAAYDTFTEQWLTECKRILKPHGTIWVSGTHHNIFRIGKALQDLQFWILNDIIWVKNNPMPNFLGRRFCAAHETLIWAVNEKDAAFTFHYPSMKQLNGGKQMRSDWLLPICSGHERLKVNGKKAHSTQKPAALLYRIILSSTNPNDVILDPFFGSGTTGAVAKLLGRQFIGIEQNTDYITLARQRIAEVEPLSYSSIAYPNTSSHAKIPFGLLLEKGMVQVGAFLYSPDGKQKARILPNATIRYARKVSSIHLMARKASGMDGMNGFEYWHIRTKDRLISLNTLRKLYEQTCLSQPSQSISTEKDHYSISLYNLAQKEGFLSFDELATYKAHILHEYQTLNERGRRIYAARQVLDFGWGGQRFIAQFLNISRDTIRKGLREIQQGNLLEQLPINRQRQS